MFSLSDMKCSLEFILKASEPEKRGQKLMEKQENYFWIALDRFAIHLCN